jgi:hypothetical protein
MKASRTILALLLGAVCSFAPVASIMAGGAYAAKVQPYEVQIKSIKVVQCGMQPGSCEGSIILAKAGGGEEVTLAIKPGTWLKRGDQFVTIDELGVGNYVKVEAVQIPGQQLQQITVLDAGRSE